MLPSATNGALILAAGKGTRMMSSLPKVLHTVLGDTMILHVVNALKPIYNEKIWAVIGHGAELVQNSLKDEKVNFVEQLEQKGTGHALMCAMADLKADGIEDLLIINGDTPLIKEATIQKFLNDSEGADLAFATLTLPDPASFGRVIRHKGKVVSIVEAKDLNPKLHGTDLKEINAGLYRLKLKTVASLLKKLTTNNKSGEYYLTDIVALAVERKMKVLGVNCGHDPNLLGVNTPLELAVSEEGLRHEIVYSHLANGVEIHHPTQVMIGAQVKIEPGTKIFGPCHILGQTSIKAGTVIEPYCYILNSFIEADAKIHAYSHLENSIVKSHATIGPYARLRPQAVIKEKAKVGNFVEVKKSILGKGSKINHLSYLGDATVGENVNIGAGTITCNYDGKNKFNTIIEDNTFIGSNTALVAPVTIGKDSVVGAGSTISKDVLPEHLGITRSPQKNIRWKK